MDNFYQDNLGGFGGGFDCHVETPEETAARNAGRYFGNLAENLQNRQQAVWQALNSRCGMAASMGQFGFQDCPSPDNAGHAANHAMNRLKSSGPLGRRFGGMGVGFSLNWPEALSGNAFSASDLSIRLYGTPGVTVLNLQQEPNCWRSFTDSGNVVHQLKPDLYAVTSDGNYEDHWFFEYDAGKEPASRVIQQCRLYEDYYNSGAEQRGSGAFPVVVWIVPDEQRKDSLLSGINQSADIQHKELFLFVLPGELEALIRKGAGI
ncbi:MAG: replication-relaxation family protein [Oscillospiraceae bacterium]|jgi:hypothetical protein|nr:replication-relaxation family protein [Oscillospiraceae bacterium]